MTTNEEWELMKTMADKQNAALKKILLNHFKNKPSRFRKNPLFNGQSGEYNNIEIIENES